MAYNKAWSMIFIIYQTGTPQLQHPTLFCNADTWGDLKGPQAGTEDTVPEPDTHLPWASELCRRELQQGFSAAL